MIHYEALQRSEECKVKNVLDFWNYFDSKTADFLSSSCRLFGLFNFVFYDDFTKIQDRENYGIYIFFDFNLQKINYIGSTDRELKQRIYEHKSRDNYKNESIIWINCKPLSKGRMVDLEWLLILGIVPGRNNMASIRGRKRR